METFEFDAELWLWDGEAAWHFITVPEDISDTIEQISGEISRGFGSVRVRVTIGATTWATSLFPDTKRGAYLLPVKAEVRRREGLAAGSTTAVQLVLVDLQGAP